MSSHTSLILLIAVLIITMGGVLVITEVAQQDQLTAKSTRAQQTRQDQSGSLILVNTIGYNITNDTYKYAKIQVRYEGDDPLDLNDTLIQVRTRATTADLYYRNGTTERDVASGFYTQ